MKKAFYEFYSNVEEKKVDWLWYPYIPYGKITVLMGDPGEGKSTFILNVISLLTAGRNMPDGYRNDESKFVIYQCSEDSVNDTIKPRLIEAKADCSKVAFIDESENVLTFDDPRLEQVIKETGARMLVLDPIQAYCKTDGDLNSAGKMRAQLKQLGQVAEKYNCAVVLVGHMNKNESSKKLYRGIGSIDITAIARSVLMIKRNEDTPNIRYMYPIKSSLTKEGKAIVFRLGNSGFSWGGVCDRKAVDDSGYGSKETKEGKVERILTEMLSEGSVCASEAYHYFENLGISKRAIKRVKKRLELESFLIENNWYWDYKEATDKGIIDEEKNSRIC